MNKVYEYNGRDLCYCGQEEFENSSFNIATQSFLFCAKYPYHKSFVRYEKNCPKDHPEYLVAYRPKSHAMALNMIDANKPEFFSDKMIVAGLDFIDHELADGRNVTVVCNHGESRSPTMCLMYMMAHGDFDKSLSHSEVFSEYMKVAPDWKPNNGILQYCIEFWNKVKRGEI